MSVVPGYADIEAALRDARDGRGIVLRALLDYLLQSDACADPFLAVSRLFCRLKSADSIVEKLRRKGIQVRNASDVLERIPDVLGFRIVAAHSRELAAIDDWVCRSFDIVERRDRTVVPGEFGERDIQYSARCHADGRAYDFELQARTVLQHRWATESFHLFHKKSRDTALAQQPVLLELAAALARADQCIDTIAIGRATTSAERTPADVQALTERVHLVVVEPGEIFADHVIQAMSGDRAKDHAAIVATKVEMYERFPRAAIVECSCLNFLAFHFNEPLVRVPMELIGRTLL